MDIETMQILNLSPIPELSEIELSTMLEQLSGLSDINGDLTDRNVEDILKEAEDLLDRSICSQSNESRSLNKSPEPEENKLVELNVLNEKEQNFQPSDLEESKQTVSGNSQVNTLNENVIKECNSSVENLSAIYSPCSSSNPIKSTIDSLKEFSKLIEKKLANQSSNSSPKNIDCNKKNQNEFYDKEVILSNSPISKKSNNTKQVTDVKTVKTPDLITKKDVIIPLDKSVKLLNCFERLYRDKPMRLNSNKLKVDEKVPKTVIKKKLTKDLKNNNKNNCQGKNLIKKTTQDEADSKTLEKSSQPFDNDEEVSKQKQIISNCLLNEEKYLLENEDEDETSKQNSLSDNFQSDGVHFGQSRMDEKLMLKVLEGMEEIKDEVKRVGAISDRENGERITKDNNEVDKVLKTDVNSGTNLFEPDNYRIYEIQCLEQQFCVLKEKYNHQIDKLEAENLKLKEALKRQQENFISQEFGKIDTGGPVLKSWSPEKNISRTLSLENCKAPKNSPCSSLEDVQTSTTVKEAFCQTEKYLKNTSIQCSQDSKEVGTNIELISETKKNDNKENFISKKKPVKNKPFADLNVHQMTLKQKKAIEHESQLLATLRGLQTEITLKDKENKKLKNEIETLKKQMKKLGSGKIDNFKRCNIGTQTIGLGAFFHKPYNPENYQVSLEFEKENEDLRTRIKALEEDFEFLKEKRIIDLQSLHQVHEEEMAKLISKLDTQSALTKHLHSLLVNR